MIPNPDHATPDRMTIVLLHYLGGSALEWDEVAASLGDTVAILSLDFAGFGDAAAIDRHTVEAMANTLADAIRMQVRGRYMLVGHSMGAKMAAVVARRAENGEAGLGGLAGLVMLAGSPPEPEPMTEDRRADMLGWFAGDATLSRRHAERFVAANVAAPLPKERHERAIADLLRMDVAAWRAWLERGTREDWSAFVGRLATPTLLLAGEEDGDLGPDAQRAFAARHFDDARIEIVAGAAHLLPLERPDIVARLIADHATRGQPVMPAAYRTLLGSDRVSTKTRHILFDRARPVDDAMPRALTAQAHATLAAVLDRVVPQRGASRIDLAARIDTALATGPGDGWRFADLPPDAQAYALALAALADAGFDDATPDAQDALLSSVADGTFAPASAALNAGQMAHWFEDLRADAVRTYVAHPATLARIGYSGIANGGDGVRKQGFERLAAASPEPWEPVARTGASA